MPLRFGRRRPVRRRRDGSFVLELTAEEVTLLSDLGSQLDPLLDDPAADSGLRRLFPPAHPEDLLDEAAWQIEQGARLRESRRDALAALAIEPGTTVTEEELIRWMNGLNALRLVLAERLGVTTETDEETVIREAAAAAEDPDHERSEEGKDTLHGWMVYLHLAGLMGSALEALGAARPDDD